MYDENLENFEALKSIAYLQDPQNCISYITHDHRDNVFNFYKNTKSTRDASCSEDENRAFHIISYFYIMKKQFCQKKL